MLLFILGYSILTYVLDGKVRRNTAAAAARAYANRQGKPMLNVGAGVPSKALMGPYLAGDVNIDLAGRKDVAHGTPGVVTYGEVFGYDYVKLIIESGWVDAELAAADPEEAVRLAMRMAKREKEPMQVPEAAMRKYAQAIHASFQR